MATGLCCIGGRNGHTLASNMHASQQVLLATNQGRLGLGFVISFTDLPGQ